jgi:hypothetical protein
LLALVADVEALDALLAAFVAEVLAELAEEAAAVAEVPAAEAEVADNCALYLEEYSPPATGPEVLVAHS